MFSALERSELFILQLKNGVVTEPGAFADVDNDKTLRRTAAVLSAWFKHVTEAVPDWWAKGAGDGGGLAMNDGVVALIGVLRSVVNHLTEEKHLKLNRLTDDELISELKRFASVVGSYLGGLNEDDRKQFRDLRGVQGVTTRQRRIQQALRVRFSDFNPPGNDGFCGSRKPRRTKKAKAVLDEIEVLLLENVVGQLKEEYGAEADRWWYEGVPQKVREEASQKLEQDGGARKVRERYFDLIHYRTIIMNNWELLQGTFAWGKKGVGKEKGTAWIQEINNLRRAIAHPTSGVTVSLEQLSKIEGYRDWLKKRIENPDEPQSGDEASSEQ